MNSAAAPPESSIAPEALETVPDTGKDGKLSENIHKLPERNKPPKAKKEKVAKPPKGPTPSKPKREPATASLPNDPDSMFKVGFLADVYQERPIGSGGISKVVTRCQYSLEDLLD